MKKTSVRPVSSTQTVDNSVGKLRKSGCKPDERWRDTGCLVNDQGVSAPRLMDQWLTSGRGNRSVAAADRSLRRPHEQQQWHGHNVDHTHPQEDIVERHGFRLGADLL